MSAEATIAAVRERFPRVAVVHDWLTIPGGSEEVVLELLKLFPDAELFTSVYDPEPWPPAITERRVHTTVLQRLPGATVHYPRLLPLMSVAFEAFDLSRFDLVVSSSHANAKNVRVTGDTVHVCYSHTPMRYAWEPEFLRGEEIGRGTRAVLPALLWMLRRRDRATARRPDLFVANSRHVQARIGRYYGRSAIVVHPPVRVAHFLTLERAPEDFYLCLGRTVPYKRLEIAIQATRQLGRRLVIAGSGRGLSDLRRQAGPHVEFRGQVSDAERDELLSRSRALLFPGEEDFGIVPVEAQAAGAPVIAYGAGGALETIRDGETGVLFAQQSADGLARAIVRFEGLTLEPGTARRHAETFSEARFLAEMATVIADAQPRPDRQTGSRDDRSRHGW